MGAHDCLLRGLVRSLVYVDGTRHATDWCAWHRPIPSVYRCANLTPEQERLNEPAHQQGNRMVCPACLTAMVVSQLPAIASAAVGAAGIKMAYENRQPKARDVKEAQPVRVLKVTAFAYNALHCSCSVALQIRTWTLQSAHRRCWTLKLDRGAGLQGARGQKLLAQRRD